MVNTDLVGPQTKDPCQRLLSLAGEPNARWLRPYVESMISILMLHLAFRDAVRFLERGEGWRLVMATVLGACFLASLSSRLKLSAARLALLMLIFKLSRVFPSCANHFYLEVLSVALISIGYRPDTTGKGDGYQELRSLSQSFRWTLIIMFFWSGVRKLGQGTYANGSFLASTIRQEGSPARDFFQVILPNDEFTRLVNTEFPGPFLFDSPFPVVLSNAVYLVEIAIPVLLLTQRFRTIGFWLTFGSIVAIEVVARELMFGGLFVLLLLFFTEGKLASRLLPVFAAYYAILFLITAGAIPGLSFN